MPTSELERLIRFCHPEKILGATRLPGAAALGEEALAALYGTTPGALRAAAAAHERDLAPAANRLRAAAAALPLARAGRLLAVGDSITDDRLSWAEILRRTGCVEVVNAGLSGDTTAGVVSRLRRAAACRPDWIVLLVGTNDARRHGRRGADVLVSDAETARNLGALRQAALAVCPRVLWVTPPPVREDRILADRGLAEEDLVWREADVAAKAALVRAMPGRVVDVWPAFGSPAARELLLDDGLHPSLIGQALIAAAVLHALAEG